MLQKERLLSHTGRSGKVLKKLMERGRASPAEGGVFQIKQGVPILGGDLFTSLHQAKSGWRLEYRVGVGQMEEGQATSVSREEAKEGTSPSSQRAVFVPPSLA